MQRDVLKAYGSFENIFPKLVVISIEKIEREMDTPYTCWDVGSVKSQSNKP